MKLPQTRVCEQTRTAESGDAAILCLMIVDSSKTQEPAVPADSESPPSYASASSSSGPTVDPNGPPPMRRHNFLYIRREYGPVNGTWVINPDLVIPEDVLPPIPPNTDRKNLTLISDFGTLNANVWIVPGGRKGIDGIVKPGDHTASAENSKPTTIEGLAMFGGVTIRVYAETPFQLQATSKFGKVAVGLPRTFTGPITITNEFGKHVFSPAIEPQVSIFSDLGNTVKGFIGDTESSGYSQGGWTGSSLELICKFGPINVYYVDELDKVKPFIKRGSFWWPFG